MASANQYMFLVGRARPGPVKKARRTRIDGELVTPEQVKAIDVLVARFARHGVAREDCLRWCLNHTVGGYQYGGRDYIACREPGHMAEGWPGYKKHWRADVRRHLDVLFFRCGPRYGEWPGEWPKL